MYAIVNILPVSSSSFLMRCAFGSQTHPTHLSSMASKTFSSTRMNALFSLVVLNFVVNRLNLWRIWNRHQPFGHFGERSQMGMHCKHQDWHNELLLLVGYMYYWMDILCTMRWSPLSSFGLLYLPSRHSHISVSSTYNWLGRIHFSTVLRKKCKLARVSCLSPVSVPSFMW